MKRSYLLGLAFMMLLLLVAIYISTPKRSDSNVQKTTPSGKVVKRAAKTEPGPDHRTATITSAPQSKKTKQTAKAADRHSQRHPSKPNPSSMSMADLVATSSIRDAGSLRRAVIEMKSRSADEVANGLIDAFNQAPDFATRERTLWFATKLNVPELFPLWEDVLLRRTPAWEDEAVLFANSVEIPNDPRLLAAQAERSQAVSSLGAIQAQSPDAHSLLMNAALGKGEVSHLSTTLRMQAARELHANDRLVLLKLSRELEANDPLLARLSTMARQERKNRKVTP